MMQSVKKVRFEGREDWLEKRRHSIGGSDAAAIMGLNPYNGAYALWAEKTGRIQPKDLSEVEAVRLGVDLEDYVAHRFMEKTGKKVRRENSILYNEDIPFAHATVDRLVVGEDAGLECKTTSALNLKRFKNGDFPATYYCQCQHYMMVTGMPKWYLAVLVLGREFLVFEIERVEEDIAALRGAEETFWRCVEDDVPPPTGGTEADSEAIEQMYPASDGSAIELFGRERMIEEYLALGAQKKEIERQQDAIKQQICADMGAAELGYAGDYKVSWKSQTRTTIDKKRLFADFPAAAGDAYVKTSCSRVFRIS